MYLLFADQTGTVDPDAKDQFCILGGLYAHCDEWQIIKDNMQHIKKKSGIYQHKEVKWSDLTGAIYCKEKGIKIKRKKCYFYLNELSVEEIKKLGLELIGICNSLSSLKIIIVICDIKSAFLLPAVEKYTYKQDKISRVTMMCLQNLIQRFHFDLQDKNSLGMVFIDQPASKKERKEITRIFELLTTEEFDYFVKYTRFVETLSLLSSRYSPGIQLADLVSGCFAGYWREYDYSTELLRSVKGKIRRGPNGKISGYGVIRIPERLNEDKLLDLR